jgi:S1-C subfamily serine protease
MKRTLVLLVPLALVATACRPKQAAPTSAQDSADAATAEAVVTRQHADAETHDVRKSVVRINSTRQSWNTWQPWEKSPPVRRNGLGAITGPQQVLTTAELAADATYLEFESPDGTQTTPAKVLAADYEANLALLGPADPQEGAKFFEGSVPLGIAQPAANGVTVEMVQIETKGTALLTPGVLQSVDLSSGLVAGNSFLTYRVKASMQGAASSFTLPALLDGKLAGVLLSYDSKDQICDVIAPEIVSRFLAGATDGDYKGFPSLGVGVAQTDDPQFRLWLGLSEDDGGAYIRSVRKGSAADKAGLRKGDVITAVNKHTLDRRGFYDHALYGKLPWSHVIRGECAVGDTLTMAVMRDGKPIEVKAILSRQEESEKLVPDHLYDAAPNFLVKGGLVFQELSRPMLESMGEDWQSRAPLNLLDALENPEKFEKEADRVVVLTASIPTPATVGYESLSSEIVRQVNGKRIRHMKDLVDAFDAKPTGIHSIEFESDDPTIYLDESVSAAVDAQLLERGLTRLSRTNGKP